MLQALVAVTLATSDASADAFSDPLAQAFACQPDLVARIIAASPPDQRATLLDLLSVGVENAARADTDDEKMRVRGGEAARRPVIHARRDASQRFDRDCGCCSVSAVYVPVRSEVALCVPLVRFHCLRSASTNHHVLHFQERACPFLKREQSLTQMQTLDCENSYGPQNQISN